MGLIHFIDFLLSIAAVTLWVAWRTARVESLSQPRALTLIGTLKQASPRPTQAWKLPVWLLLLLVGRALLYWQVGPAVEYTPRIPLISVTLYFRSGLQFPTQMITYSFLGFTAMLLYYYFALLLFSVVLHRSMMTNSLLAFIRHQLGWMERQHLLVKLLAPLVTTMLLWTGLTPLLVWLNVLAATGSVLHTFEQGVVLGVGAYSIWQVPLGLALFLHLVNSYVYLGQRAVWDLVDETARRVLIPLRLIPLRIGRVDFAPLVGLALVFFLGNQLVSLLPRLFNRLPL